MALIRSIFLLLALAVGSGLTAAPRFKVSALQMTGNRITKPWVLERELGFAPGDFVDSTGFLYARNRLHNLSIFNDVVVARAGGDTVGISVNESWHYLPVLALSLTDGQVSDIHSLKDMFDIATLMFGGSDINFRGTAARLYALGEVGATEGVSLAYDTRWLSPSLPLAATLRFQNMRITDRHSSVLDSSRHLRLIRLSALAATRRGAPSRIGAELRYDAVQQEEASPAEGRTDRTFWVTPFAIIDRRKLEWYPGPGSYADVRANIVTGTAEFVRTQGELRGYFPIESCWFLRDDHRPAMLALRVRGATSANATPSWAHYYAGFNDAFRGYRGDKFEAAGYLAAEAELRLPLTRERTYNVGSLGGYGRRLPWGLSVVFAAERFEQQLDGHRDNGLAGVAGLLVRLPIVQLVECDLEWNRDHKTSFALSTGIRF